MPALKDFLANSQSDDHLDRRGENVAEALGADAAPESRPGVAGMRIIAQYVQMGILDAVDVQVPEPARAVLDQDPNLTGIGCRIEAR